jgi:hypothetical protein
MSLILLDRASSVEKPSRVLKAVIVSGTHHQRRELYPRSDVGLFFVPVVPLVIGDVELWDGWDDEGDDGGYALSFERAVFLAESAGSAGLGTRICRSRCGG